MPGPDDEILDRPYHASHFCCCVCAACTGIALTPEEDGVKAPSARALRDSAVSNLFDDEILDRPWYAGCYCPYTICVHPPTPMPCAAGDEMGDRPQADILGMGSNSGDPMIDVMLLAGAPLLGGAPPPAF